MSLRMLEVQLTLFKKEKFRGEGSSELAYSVVQVSDFTVYW